MTIILLFPYIDMDLELKTRKNGNW